MTYPRPIFLAAVLVTFFSWHQPTVAQQARCTDRDSFLRHLETEWRENPAARGVTNGGAVLELLVSENGATWTVIMTRPSGVSCLWAAGESWQRISPKQKGRRL